MEIKTVFIVNNGRFRFKTSTILVVVQQGKYIIRNCYYFFIAFFLSKQFARDLDNRQFGQQFIFGMTLSVIHFRHVDFPEFTIGAIFMVVIPNLQTYFY